MWEQRRLSEIDAHLRLSDPDLARTLSRRRTGPHHSWAAVLVTMFALAVAVFLGGLLAGPPAAIADGLLVAAVVSGLWLQSRRDRRRPTADPSRPTLECAGRPTNTVAALPYAFGTPLGHDTAQP
jgi:Flp pilus assembly protein TadB